MQSVRPTLDRTARMRKEDQPRRDRLHYRLRQELGVCNQSHTYNNKTNNNNIHSNKYSNEKNKVVKAKAMSLQDCSCLASGTSCLGTSNHPGSEGAQKIRLNR